jgi:predicted ATPase
LSLGLLDSAARITRQVLSEAEAHEHAGTVASARFCAGTWPRLVLGDFQALGRESAALAAFCTERKVEQIRLLAILHQAIARAMVDPTASNLSAIQWALEAVRKSGGNTGYSIHISAYAEALLMADDFPGARAALDDGFAFCERTGERYWLPDLHRLAGQIALKGRQPDWPAAEACFNEAIDLAHGQEAFLLELRAANDLARLWRTSQPQRDVSALLEPILANIEGGETARDVRTARSLLAELV